MSRRSTVRRAVPVDKLLFLRHRAKENMKYGLKNKFYFPLKKNIELSFSGVLLSSEAGFIHCWSFYGERKDMGMFYGPSKTGESILAMCTDANNQYLITGDTSGQIRIWNIENYCCSTTSPVQFDSSAPPLIHSWQGHLSPVIFCEWMDYKGNMEFIFTGSTDHTTRLWTMNGDQIGIFGQRQSWDLELLITARSDFEEEIQREQMVKSAVVENNGLEAKSFVSEITKSSAPVEVNEEPEKRPISAATTQLSEVSFQQQ